jgi:hypothetical protein
LFPEFDLVSNEKEGAIEVVAWTTLYSVLGSPKQKRDFSRYLV